MKKHTFTILLCMAGFTAAAQVNVSKAFLVGKWQVATVETTSHSRYPQHSYYDIAKDSFSRFSTTDTMYQRFIALGVVDSAEHYNSYKKDFTKGLVKDGKVAYIFYNADGSALSGFGTTIEPVKIEYSLDENTGVLTTKGLSPSNGAAIEVKVNVLAKNGMLVQQFHSQDFTMIVEYKKIE